MTTQLPPVNGRGLTSVSQLAPNEIPHVGIYKTICPKCNGPRNEFSGVCGHCGITSRVIYSTGERSR